jgi:hypothetical protein
LSYNNKTCIQYQYQELSNKTSQNIKIESLILTKFENQ